MNFVETLKNDAFGEDDDDALSSQVTKRSYDTIRGWMHVQFPRVFESVLRQRAQSVSDRPLRILEVGTWQGKSACCMASIAEALSIPVQVVCVDTWLGAPEFWTWGLEDPERGGALRRRRGYPQVYHTFLENVRACGLTKTIAPFPISSAQATEVFKYYKLDFDIIYVDGSHEYDAVIQDLKAFWPLVLPGGFMLGDDYDSFWLGVQKAVDEFCSLHTLEKKLQGVVWSVQKQIASL